MKIELYEELLDSDGVSRLYPVGHSGHAWETFQWQCDCAYGPRGLREQGYRRGVGVFYERETLGDGGGFGYVS